MSNQPRRNAPKAYNKRNPYAGQHTTKAQDRKRKKAERKRRRMSR